jgi:hypothetical protein
LTLAGAGSAVGAACAVSLCVDGPAGAFDGLGPDAFLTILMCTLTMMR